MAEGGGWRGHMMICCQFLQWAKIGLIVRLWGYGAVDGFFSVYRARGDVHVVIDGLNYIRDAAQVDGFEVVYVGFAGTLRQPIDLQAELLSDE